MPRRLLALALAALALLLGAAGCADDVSPALRVGDTTVSNDDFLAELEEWMGNPAAIDPATLVTVAPGAYPGDLVRQLLQQRLDFELAHLEFDARGLELDDSMREDALIALFGDPAAADSAFETFSSSFADEFTDDVARQVALQSELGQDGYSEWQAAAYRSIDIEVNPRYGSWDDQSFVIVAPDAPIDPAAPAS